MAMNYPDYPSGNTNTGSTGTTSAAAPPTTPSTATASKTPAQILYDQANADYQAWIAGRAEYVADWDKTHPAAGTGTTPTGASAWETVRTQKFTNVQTALARVTDEQPKPQTPDQAAQTAAQVETAKANTATATSNVATAKLNQEALAELAKQRGNPDHPGLTNKEAADDANEKAKLANESTRLTADTAVRMLQAKQAEYAAKHYLNEDERERDKFEYQKFKDALDAKVAANDKAETAKLAQQTLLSNARGQDITQRGQDVSALSDITGAYARDIAPIGAYDDMGEALKQFADPTYVPKYTNSAGRTPYSPMAMAAAGLQRYGTAAIPSLAAGLANQSRQASDAIAGTGVTAPPVGGPAPAAPVGTGPNNANLSAATVGANISTLRPVPAPAIAPRPTAAPAAPAAALPNYSYQASVVPGAATTRPVWDPNVGFVPGAAPPLPAGYTVLPDGSVIGPGGIAQ